MTSPPGLHRVSTTDIKRLLAAIHHNHIPFPITRAGLVVAAFGDLEGDLNALVGRDKAAAVALIGAVLRQRDASSGTRRGAAAELLWTGPSAAGHAAREPFESASELIATAKQSILFSGIPATLPSPLLRLMHAAQQGRDLDATVVWVGDPGAAQQRFEIEFAQNARTPSCWQALPAGPQPPACLLIDSESALLFSAPLVPCLMNDDDETSAQWVGSAVLIAEPKAVVTLEAQIKNLIRGDSFVPVTHADTP